MRYRITMHAVMRFRERDGTCDKLSDEDVRALLSAEIDRGIPFGGQVGADRLLLLPCGLVAAVTPSDGEFAVKTMLTRDHAVANMQSHGVTLRTPPIGRAKRRAVLRDYLADRENELRLLAEEHFRSGTSRKARYRALRACGFDTGGLALKRYNELYDEVRSEFNAGRRERFAALRKAHEQHSQPDAA